MPTPGLAETQTVFSHCRFGRSAASAIKERLEDWTSNFSYFDVGQVRAVRSATNGPDSPSQTETAWEGLAGGRWESQRDPRLPVDRNNAVRMDIPYATPFAWGKCGLVLPRYPGMAGCVGGIGAALDHDPIDMGAIWDSARGPIRSWGLVAVPSGGGGPGRRQGRRFRQPSAVEREGCLRSDRRRRQPDDRTRLTCGSHRPQQPQGCGNPPTTGQRSYFRGHGLKVVLWNIDSHDWDDGLSADDVEQRVMSLMPAVAAAGLFSFMIFSRELAWWCPI